METILVVDDDALVLRLSVKILSNAKFRVLSADCGHSALELSDTFDGNIDLLLSDIEMPGMKGPELGHILHISRPDLCILLMSGRSDGNQLALNYGWPFIPKPFAANHLIEMVSELLRKPPRDYGAEIEDPEFR